MHPLAAHQILTPNMTGRGFHRTAEAMPRRPWKSKSWSVSRPVKISIYKEGDTRGAPEVRRSTSSIYFHHALSIFKATFSLKSKLYFSEVIFLAVLEKYP